MKWGTYPFWTSIVLSFRSTLNVKIRKQIQWNQSVNQEVLTELE